MLIDTRPVDDLRLILVTSEEETKFVIDTERSNVTMVKNM